MNLENAKPRPPVGVMPVCAPKVVRYGGAVAVMAPVNRDQPGVPDSIGTGPADKLVRDRPSIE